MSTTTTKPASVDRWGHGPGAIVTIGHGGWAIHYRTVEGSRVSRSTLSGYGQDWRDHRAELEAGALVVDLTAIPLDRLCDLSIRGPMVDADCPAGEIRGLGATTPIDRAARFYGARSLDSISVEDYAELAGEWGRGSGRPWTTRRPRSSARRSSKSR